MKHMISSPVICFLSSLILPVTALPAQSTASAAAPVSLQTHAPSALEYLPAGQPQIDAETGTERLARESSSSLWENLQKKPESSKMEEALDPSDPFQMKNSVRLGLEFDNLANGEGNSTFFRASGDFVLNPKMKLHADLPLAWSSLSHHNTDFGLGDLRLGWYYLAKNDPDPKKLFQGVMPGVELILPTGNATDGQGGDAGLLMPYFNFKMQAGERVTVYNIFRYVHSFSSYRAAGNPDINVPSAFKGKDTQLGTHVREIWWQIPVTVKPEDMFVSWFTLTADLAWNFHDKTRRSYRFDIEAGKTIKDDFAVSANLTLPLNNGNTINWIFGVQAVLSF